MNFNWITLSSAETASDAAASTGGGLASLLVTFVPLVLLVVVMYFLMIRPQRKKEKEDKKMRENLQIGDEIVTIGGIYGRVISLKEDSFVIESKSDHSKITVARWALQSNLTIHEDTESK